MHGDGSSLGGRYVLGSVVAKGGMATVWKARDNVLARTVATKILYPHLAEDPEFLARFRREALAAARLTHPHVVAIYDTGADRSPEDGTSCHYIVMEYCGGGTLAGLIASGPLDPDRLVATAAEICDALAYAHSEGIVHRDIKPANVLLTDDGVLKVGDFGIAKAAFTTSDVTTTGSILGTVSYLSPEQLRGEEPDPRSDIYSLGVLLYEALVGRPPFVDQSQLAVAMKHLNEVPRAPRTMRAGIPRSLDATVMKALEKDPDKRFSSVAELKAELLGNDKGQATTVLAAPAARSGSLRIRRPRLRSAVPVLSVVALALVAAFVVPSLVGGGNEARDAGSSRPQSDEPAVMAVADAEDFDPHGDGEHPEAVALAHDGDAETTWETETYEASLELLQKPGVGLLFDLGERVGVDRIQIATPTPGFRFEVRASSSRGRDETAFERLTTAEATEETLELPIDADAFRYWLIWITELPGTSGGRVAIAEVEFIGS